MADDAPTADADEAAPPKSRGVLIPLLLVSNLLTVSLFAGAAGIVLLKPDWVPGLGEPSAPEEAGPAAKEGGEAPTAVEGAEPNGLPPPSLRTREVIRMEHLIVRLRNPEAARYARVGLALELASGATLKHVEARLPAVRDAMITDLADRTVEGLAGSRGLSALRDGMLACARRVVGDEAIDTVLVTDFVVQ